MHAVQWSFIGSLRFSFSFNLKFVNEEETKTAINTGIVIKKIVM